MPKLLTSHELGKNKSGCHSSKARAGSTCALDKDVKANCCDMASLEAFHLTKRWQCSDVQPVSLIDNITILSSSQAWQVSKANRTGVHTSRSHRTWQMVHTAFAIWETPTDKM